MNLCRSGGLLALLVTMAFAPAAFSAGAPTTNYAGLVYSGSTNVGAQSGMFAMLVSTNLKFSGQMFMGNQNGIFTGRFDTNGAADTVVKMIVDLGPDENGDEQYETQKLWNVHFQLAPAGDSISGDLQFRRGGLSDATLSGKRSSFNRTNEVPSPGKYTFILSGSGDPANTNFPTGNGFGIITINPSGSVDLGGSLPDKSAFSQSMPLCDDGTFPLYASSSNGFEMIQGWVGLTNSAATDLTGDVIWVKPDFTRRSFFPAGFTNELAVVGSRYVRTNPPLGWANGIVIFQGGKLGSPFTNDILFNAKGAVVNVSSNKLALKIQLSSGRFSGWAKEPSTGDRIPFVGVVLQNQSAGFGYFPDAPLSGEVLLGPAGP